jgi:uncharacterized protein (TIGR02145 family)
LIICAASEFQAAPCVDPPFTSSVDSLGCTYAEACNFVAEAWVDDGTCEFASCGGCTIIGATNYDPSAQFNDGTCIFPPSSCSSDITADGLISVADLIVLLQNFGLTCVGCAGVVDVCGVCNGPGAVFDCGCSDLPVGDCDCEGNQLDALGFCGGDCPADADGDGICDTVDDCVGQYDICGVCNGPGAIYVCGCTQLPFLGACDCAGNEPDAVGTCGGGCEVDLDGDGICDDATLSGCTVPVACNYDPSAVIDDNSCEFSTCYGCDDPEACNFSALVTYPTGDCDYPEPFYDCAGTCLLDTDGDGVCNELEVSGCTDIEACNFFDNATDDDGTCTYPGCTDPYFCNYDAAAGCDDGSCEAGYPACLDSLACNFDAMAICGGLSCAYPGCTDPAAVNYDSTAGCDDGSCQVLGCLDELACNFNGSAIVNDGSCTYPGCTDTTAVNFNPLAGCDDGSCENLGCTYEYACNDDPTAEINDGSCTFGDCPGCNDPDALNYNPTPTNDSICFYCDNLEFDGYTYSVVLIGDQCWFAENLRTTTYADGDVIPAGLTDSEWESTTSGATAVYGEGSSYCNHYSPDINACDEAQSLAEYARLYNWYAVDDARGLCPTGWHVPTDGEWTDLEDYITAQGFDGTEGVALKSTYGWYNGSNGTDDFGFSALPGGYRSNDGGDFDVAGNYGSWWSSSPSGGLAWYRYLYYDNPDVDRNDGSPRDGFSVRCLRDAD